MPIGVRGDCAITRRATPRTDGAWSRRTSFVGREWPRELHCLVDVRADCDQRTYSSCVVY